MTKLIKQQAMADKLRDEKYEREKNERHEAFINLKEKSQEYVSLIDKFNDVYSTWGLDLTSLSENISKDYPISTNLINQINTSSKDNNLELQLWKLIRKYIVLEQQKVKMNFQDSNKNFHHLLYWGNEFLNMQGIDLLYMIYILLDNQLLNTPNELNSIFDDNRMKIILPEMTASFSYNGDTRIDFSIPDVGNLNILTKRK
ncbi:MAG: hypothetical protein PHS24_03285 [Bacilli bacterium]|nr:hypothetical protein [Bacilli bacterium]